MLKSALIYLIKQYNLVSGYFIAIHFNYFSSVFGKSRFYHQ